MDKAAEVSVEGGTVVDVPGAELVVVPVPVEHSPLTLGIWLLAVIGVVGALYLGRAFFVPLLIGILASYTLHPLVDKLVTWRIPRPLGAVLVLSLLVGGLGWIGYSLQDETAKMIEKLPDAARTLRKKMNETRSVKPSTLQKLQETANEIQGAATDASVPAGEKNAKPKVVEPESGFWLRKYIVDQSSLLLTVAAQTPIVLLLTFFLLASGDHFRRKLIQFVGPTLSQKKDALRILLEIDVQVQRFLLATLASNVLLGITTWLAFKAAGMENAGVWGVATGVLHFIPYLGTVTIVLASGFAAFLQFDSLVHAIGIAAATMALAIAIGQIFMTWLQSRLASINAAVLFIALLFFGWLWGVAGLLLGAPLLAIAKVICDRIEKLKPFGELLGH